MGFGFILFIALPLFLLIGATILRAAISFANKRIGPAPEPLDLAEDEDDWSDYPVGERRDGPASAIPTPSIGRGMWMLLAVTIVNAIVTAAIRIVIANDPVRVNGQPRGLLDDPWLLSRLLTLPVGFVVTAGLLAVMLPTSFSRGCLVSVFFFLICIAISAVIAVPFMVLGFAFRGI